MELTDYVRILRRHLVGVLVLAVLGVIAAALYSYTQPSVYQATATGFVSTGKADNASLAQVGDSLAKSRVKSYVDIATSTNTALDVIQDLHLDQTPTQLINRISVDQPLDTVLIKISARSSSPKSAQQLADSWVRALAMEVAKVDGKPRNGQQGIRVVPYVSAQLPSSPIAPRTTLNLLIGLVLGLGLGLAYAFVRHQFDRRLRHPEDIERDFDVPVMASIPQSSDMREADGRVLILAVRESASARNSGSPEAIRKLRTNLAFSNVDAPPRIIVITSPKQGDGKSTIAANLAAAIAYGGQKVTLVDGDLRRPTVADSLGLAEGAGLTDLLAGALEPEDVLQTHPDIPDLRILAAGRIPPNPSELLGSLAMDHLMRELAQDGMVVIDAPPLLPVTDAAVLSRSADGVLIVISAGVTVDSELRASLGHIEAVRGRTLGVILNRVSRRSSGGSYYYYNQYYGYDRDSRNKRRRLLSRS